MITDAVWLLVELVGLFFGVAFAVNLLQRRFGDDRLRAWLGGTPVVSALKGIGLGFVTPFCTYSAIPMLIGLRQAGVPPAGYVAFITAAPVLDPVLFGALVVIAGLHAALLYTIVAFAAAMTLALVAHGVGIERHLKPIPTPVASPRAAATAAASTTVVAYEAAPAGSCSAIGLQPWRGLRREAGPATRAAFGLLRSVAVLIVVGVSIGLIVRAAVPPGTVTSITGNNASTAIPLAAALGTPLYVHTGLFVPIADSLTNAGVGIGAIVALTISGAGANVPEFIILTKLAGHRLVAGFAAYVFAVAVIGGLVAHTLLE